MKKSLDMKQSGCYSFKNIDFTRLFIRNAAQTYKCSGGRDAEAVEIREISDCAD